MDSGRGTVKASRNESPVALRNSPFWPYLSTLLREMPLKVVGALVLTVCLTLTEGMGLLMLVPLLHSVGLDVQHGVGGVDMPVYVMGREEVRALTAAPSACCSIPAKISTYMPT